MIELVRSKMYYGSEDYDIGDCHLCNEKINVKTPVEEEVVSIDPDTEEVTTRTFTKYITDKFLIIKMSPAKRLVLLEVCGECVEKLGLMNTYFKCEMYDYTNNRCNSLLTYCNKFGLNGDVEPECMQCIIHNLKSQLKTQNHDVVVSSFAGFGGFAQYIKVVTK